jgi:glycosidase
VSAFASITRRANSLLKSTPALNGADLKQATPALNDADFKPDVIYEVVLDRFFDGDPANNDSSEFGSIYKNGVYQSAYNNDPNHWFHHNGSSTDPNDQYNSEYLNLFDLSDFAQENSVVDSYLKGAMQVFLSHHVDGVRLDAVGNMPGPAGGWLRTLNDTITAQGPHYAVGEWGGLR